MKRVLVVDDDDQFRGMLVKLLQKAGYDVAGAENGRVAEAIQQENPFDLIITDIIMPDKEGIETIIGIRKSYPQTMIIAMSGGGRVGPTPYLESARSLGAQMTFSKPFKTSEILEAVRSLLKE
ncbi:MAG: Response regulator receiver protein CpdR [Syntrophus sp. SKADARSKE-3]|nr:Response regulator receiver protein CpdR [Syntrophus sp. SKADARSKE-3]